MSYYPPDLSRQPPPLFGAPARSAFSFGSTPSVTATQSVAKLSSNAQAKAWAKACGLDIVNVSWEDCARNKNSCWGPCISDMTLVVDNSWMSVLRVPNFSDPIMSIPSSSIQLTVGNESPHDGVPLTKVSLQEYLTNIAKYTELENSLFEPSKDSQVVVSTQSCFLPLTEAGDVDFHVGLFNYQSTASNPAVLVLISTDAGTSAQVVCGDRRGDILYFNDRGTKRTFQATRLTTDRSRRGVESAGAMTEDEEARNYIMIVQIPLVMPPRQTKPSFSFGAPGGFGGPATLHGPTTSCSSSFGAKPAVSFGSTPRADVEPAMVSLGQAHGPFPKLSQLSGIKRDSSYPIRVTLQFYQATSNGVMTEPIIQTLANQMNTVKTSATWCGSLLTPSPVQPANPFQPIGVHAEIFCDHCKQNIHGPIRYKCLVCPDYDRCETCVDVTGHPANHPFMRVTHAQCGPSNYMTKSRSQLSHINVRCSSCYVSPIVGILYRCTMCPSVHLCERCELTTGHANFQHPLIKQFHSS